MCVSRNYIMKTIKIGSDDYPGKIGYDKSDGTLFIQIGDNNNKTKKSIWVSKQDAMNIVKHILKANDTTTIKSTTYIKFE